MKRVFLDTNVLLDLLADRQPFAEDAALIFAKAGQGSFELHVCSLSFPNIHYLVEKIQGRKKAMEAMRYLRPLVTILPVDAHCIEAAIRRNGIDFEDDLQLECAIAADVDVILSRDNKGFKNTKIPVFSPSAFLLRL